MSNKRDHLGLGVGLFVFLLVLALTAEGIAFRINSIKCFGLLCLRVRVLKRERERGGRELYPLLLIKQISSPLARKTFFYVVCDHLKFSIFSNLINQSGKVLVLVHKQWQFAALVNLLAGVRDRFGQWFWSAAEHAHFACLFGRFWVGID